MVTYKKHGTLENTTITTEHNQKINFFLLMVLGTVVFFAAQFVSFQAKAQSNFATLNLTEGYNENFLSPYIKKYDQTFDEEALSSIVTAHYKNLDIEQNLKSLLYFGYSGKEQWLSFEVNNRSSKTQWYIDFGDYFSGRFGLLSDVDIYILDMTGAPISNPTSNTKIKNPIVKIDLPLNQKSMVVMKINPYAGLPTTLPLKVVSEERKTKLENKRLIVMAVILFGLVGMVFFFMAFAIAQGYALYSYFSIYYVAIAAFLFMHSQIVPSIPFLGGLIIPLFLSFLAIIGLFLARIFWDSDSYSDNLEKIIKGSFIAVIIAPIIGVFLPDLLGVVKTILMFGPTLLLLFFIPIITLIQSAENRNQAMPFIFGWFILLFGLSISILTLSGFMPPLSAMLNAFWYALVPQALFFTFALKAKGGSSGSHLPMSRTVEIEEGASTSRVRQSKELAEQERLMKVIEQERRILTELRKSEARRAEEMRLAKEEADMANRGKSAFLAVVTHEIRTPMTGIMGMVKMLLDSGLDKKQKDYAMTIQESSDAMLALLNDILDFEKIEQGKMQIESISFDLPRLIQGVVTLMNGHASQKGIELIGQVDPSLPHFVKGDPTRLRQVLLNLTGNAIKFTEKGSVTVKAQMIKKSADGSSCELYLGVTDSGVGISKEGQQKIFEAFSQADETVSRKFGGTGLGLAISKGLVEAMKSNININSNEGEGSTFFFTLNVPIPNQKEAERPAAARTVPQQSNVKPLRILVVDDNKINRKVVSSFLENTPHDVQTQESAKAALEIIEKERFDLIFMDIEMPIMKGDEATRLIRNNPNPKIASIPIVALTGNVNDEQIVEYRKSGMSGFLAKPIDPEKLRQLIAQAGGGDLTAPKPQAVHNDTATQAYSNQLADPKDYDEPVNFQVEDKPVIKPSASISRTTSVKRTAPPLVSQEPSTSENTFDAVVINDAQKDAPDEDVYIPMPPPKKVANNRNDAFDEEMLNSLRSHLDLEAIKSMLDEVFEKSEEIIIDLKMADESKDFTMLHSKAHELKGMTGNFGLKGVALIAADIEDEAKREKADKITMHVAQIPTALANAKAAVEKWLAE